MTIKEREKILFQKWAASRNQDISNFCPNGGLLFRGKFYLNPPDSKGVCTWNRKEGDEEKLWLKSKRKIMILTKDLNDSEPWDIRVESGGRNKVSISNVNGNNIPIEFSGIPFYRKLNRWIYGLYNSLINSPIEFNNKVQDYSIMGNFYEQVPLVRINCKIDPGKSSLSNKILQEAIDKNRDLLKEQIKIYSPNIILCCGWSANVRDTGNIILNFLIENIYEDLILDTDLERYTEGWCYYSKKYNTLAVNSYHPTSTELADKEMYDQLIQNFMKALYYIKANHGITL